MKIITYKAISNQPLVFGFQAIDACFIFGSLLMFFVFISPYIALPIGIFEFLFCKSLKTRPPAYLKNAVRFFIGPKVLSVEQDSAKPYLYEVYKNG